MADLNNFSARNITKKLDINDCGFVFFQIFMPTGFILPFLDSKYLTDILMSQLNQN